MTADAIADVRQRCRVPVDPGRRGPVLLDRFFEELNLSHVALPGMTCAVVTAYLRAAGVSVEAVGEPGQVLAGCLYWVADDGRAFVNADEILPRRRFTAAHELGHAVLHRATMGDFIADATIGDADDAESDRERDANRFAAELLMPEEIVRARAAELRATYGACPRFVLAYRLASELLVSREAARYRLKTLGVGDDD